MTNLRTAAQQALEAMYEETAWFGPTPKGAAAITALRAALAQQAEPFTPDAIRTTQTAWKMGYDAAKAETQPAEPQTTHSSECWRWHHACAVAKIERENKA